MGSNGVVVRGDRLPAFRTIEEWGSGLGWLVGFNEELALDSGRVSVQGRGHLRGEGLAVYRSA